MQVSIGMADAMRAMLDELMGKERNVPLDQRKGTDLRFNDPEVCKYALSGLCPYGLFKNTKSDLGKYGVSGWNLLCTGPTVLEVCFASNMVCRGSMQVLL